MYSYVNSIACKKNKNKKNIYCTLFNPEEERLKFFFFCIFWRAARDGRSGVGRGVGCPRHLFKNKKNSESAEWRGEREKEVRNSKKKKNQALPPNFVCWLAHITSWPHNMYIYTQQIDWARELAAVLVCMLNKPQPPTYEKISRMYPFSLHNSFSAVSPPFHLVFSGLRSGPPIFLVVLSPFVFVCVRGCVSGCYMLCRYPYGGTDF